jgi:hypothetical protein
MDVTQKAIQFVNRAVQNYLDNTDLGVSTHVTDKETERVKMQQKESTEIWLEIQRLVLKGAEQ